MEFKRYFKLYILAALIVPLFGMSVMAQTSPVFHFRTLQVDDGLSENTVYCIMQDQKGYVWFGTKDGLNRYDGNSFRIYRKVEGDPGSLGNNFIRSIADGLNDVFYIGTDAGLYKMDRVKETFEPMSLRADNGETVTTAVNSLVLRGDRLWIATMHQGVFYYDTVNKSLHKVPINQVELGSNAVWSLLVDSSETLWVATRLGLLRYNPDQRYLEAVSGLFSQEVNPANEILSLMEDQQGSLWLGMWNSGLKVYDRRTHYTDSYFTGSGQPHISHIRSVFTYTPNMLLIGSDDGLYLFNTETKQAERIDFSHLSNNFSDQNIYSILRDRENGIWIGTYFGGVNYFNPALLATELYQQSGRPGSFSGKAVSQFCEDPQGNLWIATEDGGINYFDVSTRRFSQPVRTSYHNTHALLLDGDDLWVGTFSRGLDIYNVKTGAIRNIRHDMGRPGSINDDCIFSLYKTRGGDIYLGTPLGLDKYDRATGKFTRVRQVDGFIYDICEDEYGNIWIAGYGHGVMRYIPAEDTWIRYDNILPADDPIVRSKLTCAYIDSRKRLWFGSEGSGIFLYDYLTDSFSRISEYEGLPNNVVYGILDDKFGNLWISCNRGIVAFDPKEPRKYRLYGKQEGMQSNQFNYKSSLKTRSGKFYFGGINGFNSFYPTDVVGNNNIVRPFVEVTGIRLLDGDESLDRKLKKNLNAKETISIPYNRSSFTLSYVSLSFVSPDQNEYAYRLEGVDRDWNYVGNDKNVTYVDLPPGKYRFSVKAANNDGLWNDTGDTISIEITPPVWATGFAKTLYVVLFFVSLYAAISYFLKRNDKKQAKKLEAFKSEQENLSYRTKIDFFTRIAHEIRTPLSLIKAPLEDIVTSRPEGEGLNANLDIIQKNTDRLTVLINQLLDFRKMDSDNYILKPEFTDLRQYFNDLYRRFQKTAQSGRITFTMNLDGLTNENMVMDQDVLTKVTGNLLTNAIKFTSDRIALSAYNDEAGALVIEVADNGRGVPDTYKKLIFDPFYQVPGNKEKTGTGIGLFLVRHLVELTGGEVTLSDNPEGGSVFRVELPELEMSEDHEPDIVESTVSQDPEKSDGVIPKNDDTRRFSLLVVDDNKEMIDFLKLTLSGTYKVTAFTSAAKALEAMEREVFDLVITDLMMPGIDGYSFIRRLKNDVSYCHIPAIMLSAKTEEADKIEGLNAGAHAYIEKPFSPLFLKAQIASILNNKKALLSTFNRSPLASYSILTTNKRDEEFIRSLNAEIEKHLSDMDFSIESLSGVMSVSRSNLQRKIKSICELTPRDYLRNYRLRRACEILLESDMRINEVAYSVGFNSASYFTKCFLKQYGMLPKDFLRKNLNETVE